MTPEETILLAVKHHQAGRLQEAEGLYRQVLSHDSQNADALHLLGVIAYQAGKFDASVDLIGRAIQQQPEANFHGNFGLALAASGKTEQAIAAFRTALAIQGDQPAMLWNLANSLADKGDYRDAIATYRRAIKTQPQFPEAMLNLARVLSRAGQVAEAITAYQDAVRQSPHNSDATFELGNALHAAGAMEAAAAAFRRTIALAPKHQQAMNNLGNALCSMGKLDEAITEYQHALNLGAQPAALNNLGNALCAAERIDEAVECFTRALAMQPDNPGVMGNLGNALMRKGQADEAIKLYEQSLAKAPGSALVHYNLADALHQRGEEDRAIEHCRLALNASPNFSDAYVTLGNAHMAKGDAAEAMKAYQAALAITPDHFSAQNNMGNILHTQGRFREAADAHRLAVKGNPNLAVAHWNLGLALLTCGELEEGFREYEWRWKVKEHGPRTQHTVPRWEGSALGGRRILIYAEQGFGDAIQFARYLPLVEKRGGTIILGCQKELQRLLTGLAPIEQWVFPDEMCPPYDVHCALMSLPLAFETKLETIHAGVPYLAAEQPLAEQWRQRLSGESRKKIGLVWAGGPSHASDARRSITLADLAPLAQADAVRFISLQKGAAAEQSKHAPFELTDWTDELHDFADTAALIANLDLVITVDTAVAHLAGALGKPVWVFVPAIPDWRWMLDREDSPWYPTMRLFRQKANEDWKPAIERVASALKS